MPRPKIPLIRIGLASIVVAYGIEIYHFDGIGDPTDDVIRFQFIAPALALILFLLMVVIYLLANFLRRILRDDVHE